MNEPIRTTDEINAIIDDFVGTKSRVIINFSDDERSSVSGTADHFDHNENKIYIKPDVDLESIIKHRAVVHGTSSLGDIMFHANRSAMSLVMGMIVMNVPDAVHQFVRRGRDRVHPSISDAPECVIITDGVEHEVPVLDISPEGIRIILPGLEWQHIVSPKINNRCLLRIPGGREYFASLEVRHTHYSIEDRLDSPVEIGCKILDLNEVAINALRIYCKKIAADIPPSTVYL